MITAAILNTFLITCPILMGDWYGFAASLSLPTLVLARVYILTVCRNGLDHNVKRAAAASRGKKVKLFVTLPTGDRLTIRITTGIT